jgi:ABC-type uncharacterized transport system involved in gliding motility auxiliary subunit
LTRRDLLRDSFVQLALVVLVAWVGALVAVDARVRVDLGAARTASLHPATVAQVERLDIPLTARVYVTRGLQAPYASHARQVRDVLEELAGAAGGRMRVEVVDPGDDPALGREAAGFGLRQLDYAVREADRATVRRIWMGVVLLHGERQAVVPSFAELSTFEYDLARALASVVNPPETLPVLGYTVGHGEADLGRSDGPLRGLADALRGRFELRPVRLGGPGGIPADLRALLVLGPQRSVSDRGLYQLDQYLLRGGGAAFFVTVGRPDLRGLRWARVNGGLEPLLVHHGVRVGRDLVLDRVQAGVLRLPGAGGLQELTHPMMVRATDLARDSVLTAGIRELLVPFAASVEGVAALGAQAEVRVIARSSRAAGAVDGVATLAPDGLQAILPGERRGPFDLVVTRTGTLRSAFASREVPPPDPAVPAPDPARTEEPGRLLEGNAARMIVAGSVDLVANAPAFVENVADWLAQDASLAEIRARRAPDAPLRATTARERAAWRFLAIGSGPLALVVLGALRRRRRAP